MRRAIAVLVAFLPIGCMQTREGPVLVVTASYPGANAQVIAETIAAPMEQQIIGTENLLRIESESRNDGNYVAHLRFQANADPKMAVVLVQNRIALAQPMLPEDAKRAGIKVTVKDVKNEEVNAASVALVDGGGHGRDALRALADAVVKRISAERAAAKLEIFPGPDKDQMNLDIDRDKCAKFGLHIAEFDELKKLKIPLPKGGDVPLIQVVQVKLLKGPTVVYRVDLNPAVRITGTPPEGKSAAAASKTCASIADAERRMHAPGFAVANLTGR
jgi:multidrug efflux pump subunit AcrB